MQTPSSALFSHFLGSCTNITNICYCCIASSSILRVFPCSLIFTTTVLLFYDEYCYWTSNTTNMQIKTSLPVNEAQLALFCTIDALVDNIHHSPATLTILLRLLKVVNQVIIGGACHHTKYLLIYQCHYYCRLTKYILYWQVQSLLVHTWICSLVNSDGLKIGSQTKNDVAILVAKL